MDGRREGYGPPASPSFPEEAVNVSGQVFRQDLAQAC